jgi:hypothetical protein
MKKGKLWKGEVEMVMVVVQEEEIQLGHAEV